MPKANGSGAIGEVLSTPLIGKPLIGHTQTYISIGSFNKREEADAALKYIKSKFARSLLSILKITQDMITASKMYHLCNNFYQARQRNVPLNAKQFTTNTSCIM